MVSKHLVALALRFVLLRLVGQMDGDFLERSVTFHLVARLEGQGPGPGNKTVFELGKFGFRTHAGARQISRNTSPCFRADAAFAKREVYQALEERRVKYAICLPTTTWSGTLPRNARNPFFSCARRSPPRSVRCLRLVRRNRRRRGAYFSPNSRSSDVISRSNV
jgi:hypothetical protein